MLKIGRLTQATAQGQVVREYAWGRKDASEDFQDGIWTLTPACSPAYRRGYIDSIRVESAVTRRGKR